MNKNIYFMFNIFSPKIVQFKRLCGKMWYSLTGYRRQRLRIACWITNSTDIPSENLINLDYAQKYWLCEGTSMLCLSYTTCILKELPH